MNSQTCTPTASSSSSSSTQSHWTEKDRYFARKLFAARDDSLDKNGGAGSLPQLDELDRIIVAFEEHIGHSDKGFNDFRERHKVAMNNNIEIIPSWPKLGKKFDWDNVQWDIRYRCLCQNRDKFIKKRCENVLGWHKDLCHDLFGQHNESPVREAFSSGLIKQRRQQPFVPREKWWLPVDTLLIQSCEGYNKDEPGKLLARFWAGYK